MERRGVSASFLREFRKQLPASITTSKISEEFVKKEAALAQIAYIDLPWVAQGRDARGRPFVAKATVFVSHAWGYDYTVPWDVMLSYEDEHPGTYFWFDLFVNSQFNTNNIDHQGWRDLFFGAIRDINAFVIVLSPWNDPHPLKRIWCLWELYSALLTGVPFQIRLPSWEKEAMRKGIMCDDANIMNALLCIDVSTAMASVPSDRTSILATIGASTHEVNIGIRQALFSWIKIAAQAYVSDVLSAACKPEPGFQHYLENLSSVLSTFGEMQQAIVYFQQCLAMVARSRGEEHQKFIAVLHGNLGVAQLQAGALEEALTNLHQALNLCNACYGPDHLSTAQVHINLGGLYYKCGKGDRAEEAFQTALTVAAAAHIRDPRNTVARGVRWRANSNLGDIFLDRGRYLEGEQRFRIAEQLLDDARLAESSPNHPARIALRNGLATALLNQGDVDGALALYRSNAECCRAVLGEQHSLHGACLHNVGNALIYKNEFEPAIDHLDRARQIKEAALGPQHADMVVTYSCLTKALHKAGHLADAQACGKIAVELGLIVLGDSHPHTRAALQHFRDVCAAMGIRNVEITLTVGPPPSS